MKDETYIFNKIFEILYEINCELKDSMSLTSNYVDNNLEELDKMIETYNNTERS